MATDAAQEVADILLDCEPVTALVGRHVYVEFLPDGFEKSGRQRAPSCIVISGVGGEFNAGSPYMKERLDLFCYAATVGIAQQIDSVIYAALRHWRGRPVGSFEPGGRYPARSPGKGWYGLRRSFLVNYEERA